MKFLYDPIRGLNSTPPPFGVFLTQSFGNNPIATQDTWFGNTLVKKGQYIYKVLANQDGHNGIDIAAPQNTPIYAPCDGWLIEQTAKDTGFGLRNTMRAEYGGQHFMLVFGHQDHFSNNTNIPYNWNLKSYPITAGDVIGYVDSTGASTGDHLHWSVYLMKINGEKVFPSNGFGGAIDPHEYRLFKDPPMIKKFRINDHGKLGILISEGFGGNIIYAKDLNVYQHLLQDFEVPADAPEINLP